MRYFDHNATTPLRPEAREAWLEAQGRFWANPSSPTRASAQAANFLKLQRERVAAVCGVEPERIVFTSGGTEGANAVVEWARRRAKTGQKMLLSPFEHSCVAKSAIRAFGGDVECLPGLPSGVIDLEPAQAQIAATRPALVAIMAASNETGVIQPWEALLEVAHDSGAPVLVDAVQCWGKRPLKRLSEADFVLASGHKFGAPKGVGFIILGTQQSGFEGQLGGGQEAGHRSGTEDVAGIAAMATALELAVVEEASAPGGAALCLETLEALGAQVLGRDVERLSQTIAAIMPRHKRTRWIARLDRRGFSIASGSACATGKDGVPRSLEAMGLGESEVARMIRISGGAATTEADWEALSEALKEVLNELDADSQKSRLTEVISID